MSVPCPVELMPRNAKAAIVAAKANGWDWDCSIAAGADGEELVWSVLFRARRGAVRVSGVWDGETKTTLGWYGGWRRDERGFVTALNWTALKAELTAKVAEPTAKAKAAIEAETIEHLRAIAALKPIAWPIAVKPYGEARRDCKGKAANPDWPGWLGCVSKTVTEDSPLCEAVCVPLIADLEKP